MEPYVIGLQELLVKQEHVHKLQLPVKQEIHVLHIYLHVQPKLLELDVKL
jgi:hypothetical protein